MYLTHALYFYHVSYSWFVFLLSNLSITYITTICLSYSDLYGLILLPYMFHFHILIFLPYGSYSCSISVPCIFCVFLLSVCFLFFLLYYRQTWVWQTTVKQTFAYDGRYAWSQSYAYQVCVICIWQILHMTAQISWSYWVCHIQVRLNTLIIPLASIPQTSA